MENKIKKIKIKKIKKIKEKKELEIIKIIENYINNNQELKKIFNHHKQKYKINELLKIVLFILKTGIAYRNIAEIKTNIHWNTIYKFVKKLEKYNIIEEIYKIQSILYVNKLEQPAKYLKTDTSFILNKYGIDDVTYNPQVKKHKTMKISIITDYFNIPIYINSYNSKIHDAEIFSNDIKKFHEKFPTINKKIILGDTAYDSIKLSSEVKIILDSELLSPKNKRNIKDKIKLQKIEYSLIEKQILKSRNGVEYTFNKFKKYKRIQLRYDKYIKFFNFYFYLAALDILMNQNF